MTAGRYWQCDDTCTVDCGACKGAGRPCTAPELVAAVEFGDTIDQGERVIDWPCSTAAALRASNGEGTTS